MERGVHNNPERQQKTPTAASQDFLDKLKLRTLEAATVVAAGACAAGAAWTSINFGVGSLETTILASGAFAIGGAGILAKNRLQSNRG